MVFLGTVIFGYLSLYSDRHIKFSYLDKFCIEQLTPLPKLYKQTVDSNFKVSYENELDIAGVKLFASKICFEPKSFPQSGVNTIRLELFGPIGSKSYILDIPNTPVLSISPESSQVPISKPLLINLSEADRLSTYSLTIGDNIAICETKITNLSCDLSIFDLEQGKNYSFKIERLFKNESIAVVLESQITITNPIVLVQSSVKNGQIVYDKPNSYQLEFDKTINVYELTFRKVMDSGNYLDLEHNINIDDKKITISPIGELERNMNYQLGLNYIEADDGSTLGSELIINFKLSSGPSVASIDADPTSQPLSQTLTITMDQNINQSIDIAKYVNISGVNATTWKSGNKIYIKYANAPLCNEINITLSAGLSSEHGITQPSKWSFKTRTICYETSIIGYSVNSRPIYAYSFGQGSTTILFSGGIHGDEPSGSYLLRDLIYDLDKNFYSIPADRKVIVVPEVSPDGIVNGSRYNSNNVNLGRNFPTLNWTSDVSISGGTIAGAGGPYPLSEPEAVALANLTSRFKPRLEVSYHAQGSLVGANQASDSAAIADLYAKSVGYRNMVGIAEQVLGYSLTGEYEDWMSEQYGLPAILIELPTRNGRYFSAHRAIIWKMLSI